MRIVIRLTRLTTGFLRTGHRVDIQDKSFINNFMLVLGFLVAAAVAFYVMAHIIASQDYSAKAADPLAQELLTERLAPVGQVYVGKVPPAAQQSAGPSAAGAAAGKPQSGKEIWQGTCSACHATGVAGAPKIGDKSIWAKHIAKGLQTLEDHALHGYHGPEGFMPAKGGNPSLTDQQVIKALKYMVGQSGGEKLIKGSGK